MGRKYKAVPWRRSTNIGGLLDVARLDNAGPQNARERISEETRSDAVRQKLMRMATRSTATGMEP